MPSTSDVEALALFDAGMFIGALLRGDSRYTEARPIVEAARRGEIQACTTPGILNLLPPSHNWNGRFAPCSDPAAPEAGLSLQVRGGFTGLGQPLSHADYLAHQNLKTLPPAAVMIQTSR